MGIAIGIILCMVFLGNIAVLVLLYLVYKVHQVQEQQVTDICNIEDELREIKGFLSDDFEAHHNQN